MLTTALRVLEILTRSKALNGLLGAEPYDDDLFDRQAAALSLVARFSQLQTTCDSDGDGDTNVEVITTVRRELAALSVLMRASRLLRAFPMQKREFWRHALEHPACRSLLTFGSALEHRHTLRYDDPAFPRLVLNFSHGTFLPQIARVIADWQCGEELDESWVKDARALLPETSGWDLEPVTLRLHRYKMTVDDIERMAMVLSPRRLVAGSKGISVLNDQPRFRVAAIDLSDSPLDEGHLKALANVIRSAGESLDSLMLVNVMARRTSPSELAAFRLLIRAAAGLDRDSRGVRCLSLARNSLTIEHFASVCSAVQDSGSSIEELSLERTISVYSPNDRFYTWWWLAVTISRRVGSSTGRLRRVDLSRNVLFRRYMHPWSTTLWSPPSELLCESNVALAPSVCRLPAHYCRLYSEPASDLKSGKHIEEVADMFTALPTGSEVSLNTLGVDNTDWVFVIVPGYGLAWAPPPSTPTGIRAIHNRRDDKDGQRQSSLVDLEMRDLVSTESLRESLRVFLESVGDSLQSMSIKRLGWCHQLQEDDLEEMLAHCPHLERLDFEGTFLEPWAPLSRAMAGPLRSSLRSLNIHSFTIPRFRLRALTLILTGPEPHPALEELRLGNGPVGLDDAESLKQILRVNKRLRVLELPLSGPGVATDDLSSDLDREFQDELLGVTPVPLRCKLAFLSVLLARDDARPLDVEVVRHVFGLAASERRRRLVWGGPPPP